MRLSAGETRYKLYGSNNKNVEGFIVCVHGLTQPSPIVWNEIGLAAETRNYQLLSYDLFGRGGSEAPYLPNTPELFSSQLAELLWTLERRGEFVPTKPIILLGMSMGGAIATHFTSIYPDVVGTLVLFAPAGLGASIPLIARVVEIPILGDILMRHVAPLLVTGSITAGRAGASDDFWSGTKTKEKFIQLVQDNLVYQFHSHPGFGDSLLSTLRHFPLNDMESVFESLPRNGQVDVHLVWGSKDTTCPLPALDLLQKLMPSAHLHVIEGGSHNFLIARSPEILQTLFSTILSDPLVL